MEQRNVSKTDKNKYNLIVFVILPICFITGLLLSALVASLLNLQIDLTGIVFVVLCAMLLYVMCVVIVSRTLKKQVKKYD